MSGKLLVVMKIIKWLAGIAACILLIFIVVGLFLSKNYEVRRSVTVNAPIDKVQALIGDLNEWDKWTPWTEGDPTLEVTMGETNKGVGASQSWNGRDGDGRLVLTKYGPNGIEYDLFFMGDAYKAVGGLNYTEQSGGVTVEWFMTGRVENPIIGGYLASMMDGMTGPMFELGLSRIKEAVEAP